MPDSNFSNPQSSDNSVQQEPIQNIQKKKKPIILIVLIVFIAVALLGLTAYIAYTLGKNKCKEASSDDISQSQEDASQDTDTSTQDTSSTTTTTTITTNAETDPYEGWEPIELETCHISLYYPSEWYTDDYEYGDYCTRISTLETISGTEASNLPILITIGVFLSEYNTPEDNYEALKQYPSVDVITGTKEVDGKDRFYVTYTDEYDHISYHIFYKVNDVYYEITWQGNNIEENQDKIDKLIDSIEIE